VSNINFLFQANFAVFSVFAALLLTEIMGSIYLIFFWDKSKKEVIDYSNPIWEVTGTFGAFWLVNSYFAYPAFLVPVARIFGYLLIVFVIFFVGRNSSIAFGESFAKRKWLDKKTLYKSYAVSTVLVGSVMLIFFSALISGKGVDLSAGTFSIYSWIVSPGSLTFVFGTLILGVGLGPVFFSLKSFRKMTLPITGTGLITSVASLFLYSPRLVSAWIVIPIILTVSAALLFHSDKTTKIISNKAVFIALFSVIIFSLQFLIYPSLLGKTLSVDSFTISGAVASVYLVMTMAGGSLVIVMITIYVIISKRKNNRELNVRQR
jgi:cytochrome bd ubiquinol oxidase subunit II